MQILITIPDGVYSFVQEEWSDVDPTIETPLYHIMRGILDGKIIKDNDAISRSALRGEYRRCKENCCDNAYDVGCQDCEYGIIPKYVIDRMPSITAVEKKDE